jgi:hypothetical protein
MNRMIKAVSGAALLVAGCAGVDPDEAGVPNGEDFEVAVLTQNGANLNVQVGFYDNFNALVYYMYFDHDQDGTADFLISCAPNRCDVNKGDASGSFPTINYSGVPTVSGQLVTFEFPISALEVNSPNTSNYWFFKMADAGAAEDRMPDSGYQQFTF